MPKLSAEETIDLVKDLVRIPSVNPQLDPNGTGESEIAAFCADWLHRHGVVAHLEDAAEGRPNVIARVGSGETVLALCAHLDTVPAGDMNIPLFEPVITGGRLHGRGSYDMKGGLAAVMAAAVELAGADVGGTVLLALVVDEEYESIGAADWVRRHTADACIITEPSELQLILAHKGFMWIEIETRGAAAHGSRFDLGESAVTKMAPIITALHAFDESVLRTRCHELTGPASLHAATIEGGSGWSIYAATCRLRVERRIVPGEQSDDVFEEIVRIVSRIDPDAGVRQVFHRSPSTCAEHLPIARAVLQAGGDVLGAPPTIDGVAYWMDAAVFAEAGIPTVNIGPAGAGAHAANEWVDIDSVLVCARVLVAAAHRFFALDTSSR